MIKDDSKIFIIGIASLLILLLSLIIYYKFINNPLDIYHYVLRDRVIVTDQILMKKTLYVAYRMKNRVENRDGIKAIGKLFLNGDLISEATSLNTFEDSFRSGTLAFLLPYPIGNGLFIIQIGILDQKGKLIADSMAQIDRNNLHSVFSEKNDKGQKLREELFLQYSGPKVRQGKGLKESDYIIGASSPLEYIFHEWQIKDGVESPRVIIETVKNKFEPFTFSMLAHQDLGEVKISISDLVGKNGIISKNNFQIGWIESVEETYGLPEGKYLKVPALIRPGNQIRIKEGEIHRIWITIRIDEKVIEGNYDGTLFIEPETGRRKAIPIHVTVFPILLEDIPQKDFFMLMTYEFTELTNPWREEDKKKIYEGGCKILKNYKEHGMTSLCFHSPFVLMTHEDGKPNLDDILAGLKAAKENGFDRPIIWYMGHLIQTAKPRHPGNIIGFDREIHLGRLDYLMREVTKFVKENGTPEVIFSPIDEADDSLQDYQSQRKETTPLLLQTIAKNQAKSLLIAREYGRSGLGDYFCSSEYSPSVKKSVQQEGKRYLLYNNRVTIACRNPAYARYIYGYYVWKHGIDGMASWTFQNTQNASGNPTLADNEGNDTYLAYPDPNGPLNTLKWEAIREGIDDYKLIYQLEKRIKRLEEKGISDSKYEKILAEIRGKKGEPPCQLELSEEWSPSYFAKLKHDIILLILEADQRLKFAEAKKGASMNRSVKK